MSTQSSQNGAIEQTKKQRRADEKIAEQERVQQTAGQQTVQTGLFPAPAILRRFAKAL
jgi:hypothetical protein